MTKVLKLAAYRRLLLAYGLTEVAWLVVSVALAILVYGRTGSALGAASFFLSAQFVPAFVSPSVVARLDRRSVRPVLSVLYVLESALLLLLALLVGHLAVGFVLALALLDGVIALAVRSLARAAAVAVTQPAGVLREGNALANTVGSITLMAGPALGGLIVAVTSVRVGLLVAAGMVILIALTLVTAQDLPEAVPAGTSSKGRLAAALRYVRDQPALRSLLALQAIGLVFFTMSIPVELVLAQHTLRSGPGGYGALLTTWGGGAIVGSAVFARLRTRSSALLIAIGGAALAVGFVIMGVAPTIVVAAVGSAVAGIGNGLLPVAGRTALQEHSRPEWMALVMSLNESIWQAVPGLGILLGGAVAQLNGPRTALLIAGAASALIVLVVPLVLRRSLGPVVHLPDAQDAPVAPLTFAAQQQSSRADR